MFQKKRGQNTAVQTAVPQPQWLQTLTSKDPAKSCLAICHTSPSTPFTATMRSFTCNVSLSGFEKVCFLRTWEVQDFKHALFKKTSKQTNNQTSKPTQRQGGECINAAGYHSMPIENSIFLVGGLLPRRDLKCEIASDQASIRSARMGGDGRCILRCPTKDQLMGSPFWPWRNEAPNLWSLVPSNQYPDTERHSTNDKEVPPCLSSHMKK